MIIQAIITLNNVKHTLHPFSLKSLIYIEKNENNLHETLIKKGQLSPLIIGG